jgi:hypothetical protein
MSMVSLVSRSLAGVGSARREFFVACRLGTLQRNGPREARTSHRETATRVHGFFAVRCPVYRTFKPAIARSWYSRH